MMIILTVVLVSTIVFINLFVKNNGVIENTQLLNDISRDGRLPNSQFYAEDSAEVNLAKLDFAPTFLIKLDLSESIIEIESNMNSYDDSEIISIIEEILTTNLQSGSIDDWEYAITKTEDGSNLVLRNMEYTIQELTNRTMLISSIIFGACGLILLALVCIFLANFVSKPVADAFERQRRFISDASHELKTPISIISLNAGILEEDYPDNTQIAFIQQQSQRMDFLVKELLNSSKLENKYQRFNKSLHDVSNAIYEVVLPFESVAFEKGIQFNLSIQDSIFYKVDIEKLQQVFVILVDNAIKYSDPNTYINIHFYQEKRKIHFSVENKGDHIKQEDLKHLFERFYKVDKSRTQNGSYGLGLSIAKEIVDRHKGKIMVTSDESGCTKFEVVL